MRLLKTTNFLIQSRVADNERLSEEKLSEALKKRKLKSKIISIVDDIFTLDVGVEELDEVKKCIDEVMKVKR